MFSALISALTSSVLYFILHIQNTSSFPKPLKASEEKEQLQKMKNGSKEARAILIERNLRLVSHIVKKYYSKTNDTEDLISIGTIGLIKAIDSFDCGKGTRLATYAARCIENEILMHFRNNKKSANDLYLNDYIETDNNGNTVSLLDTIPDESNIEEETERKLKETKMLKLIKEMPNGRDKKILIMRYGLNNKPAMTQQQVADELKISRSYVSRIEKKLLNELRKKIED